jgi:hypothetical protein
MTQHPPAGGRAGEIRTRVRVGGSLLVSCAVAVVIWRLSASDHPQLPDNIVGYPSFVGFDYGPQILAQRLVVWVVPLLTFFLYWLSGRVGPLREPVPVRQAAPSVAVADSVEEVPGWRRLVRLVPPALVVAVAAQAHGAAPTQELSRTALVAGLGYLVLVLLATAALAARGSNRIDSFSRVNAVAAAAGAVAGLGYFARHTGTVDLTGAYQGWPWFPLWSWVVAVAVTVALVAWWLMRGAAPEVVEHRVVTVLVGSVLVYLLVAAMPGAVPQINGFDDMHTTIGADLFSRGYFPWRDVLLTHGVFEDGLRTSLGFALFGHTVWASYAVASLVWGPLLWVGYYLLLVWAAPRRWLLQLAFIAAVPWASNWIPVALRWVAVGFVFLLLGSAIRRSSRLRTVALTVVLFVGAILVPEMSFQVVAVAVVLVTCDLTERDADTSRWAALGRTRVFVVTGVALTVAWAIFLTAMSALGDWIDYYLVFGPGHAATGTFPVRMIPTYGEVFFVSEFAVIATISVCLARLLKRRRFTPRQWVLFSSAILVGLYAEKGLDRFDAPHIGQVLTAAVPMWVLIFVECVGLADARLSSVMGRRWHRLAVPLRHPTAAALVLVMTFVAPHLLHQTNSVSQLDAAPGNNRTLVPDQADQPPLVGYSSPGGTNMTMVKDLSTLTDTLAPGGLVYDFTNSPGYFTYLMQQPLTSRFYTLGLALTELSQDLLLDDLKKANPEVVVFDSSVYGLGPWDGPRDEVRDYKISPFLLNGWTPVVSVYGFLFMVRNDLVAALPPLPKLAAPEQTRDLDFSMPTCEWGHVPDYLRSDATGKSVDLEVGQFRAAQDISVSGWTYDFDAKRPAQRVLLAVGGRVVAQTETLSQRPDVAASFDDPAATTSGFAMSALTFVKGTPFVYAVLADGRAHPVGPPADPLPRSLQLPGGRSVRVAATPKGVVEGHSVLEQPTASVRVPAGVDLRDFGLATFSSDSGPVGDSSVRLTDTRANPSAVSRDITFTPSAWRGDSVPVRVGSCLQWQGYGRHLALVQSGGNPITSIRLSGVSSE